MGDIIKLIDARIFLYVIIAGGITEGIMRAFPGRKRWAIVCSFGIAIAASLVDGYSQDLRATESVFRGLIAAAISNSGYDIIKNIWENMLKK